MLAAALDSLTPVLPVFGLIAVRVGVAFLSLPAPFSATAPASVRTGLALLVSIAIALPYLDSAPLVDTRPMALLRASVGEVLIGATLGLAVRIVLAAADVAGTFAGFTMGLGFANAVDPTLGEQGMVTASIFRALAGLIFFVLEGHHALIGALSASVGLAAPGQVFAAVSSLGIVELGTPLLEQGLRIAAPVVGTMFITQLAIALVSRAAPKVQLFSFTFALASGMGMLTLFVSAPSVATAIAVAVRTVPQTLGSLLGG